MGGALNSNGEIAPSVPQHSTTPAPESLSQFLDHAQRHVYISQRDLAGKTEPIYALKRVRFLLEAAEGALLDAFEIGFQSANDGLENTPFSFVESVLAALALKGALSDTLDRTSENLV